MRDILIFPAIIGFFVIVVILFMRLTGVPIGVAARKVWDWFFGPSDARRTAAKLGFTVRDVWRECPTIEKGRLVSLNKERCVQYTLSYPSGKQGGKWEMLQRFPDKKEAKLPKGFIVTGDVTEKLIKKLVPLAQEFGHDYYEFESTERTLSAFWWETDEKGRVKKLHKAIVKFMNS